MAKDLPMIGERGAPLERHVNTVIVIPREWKVCGNPDCKLPDGRFLGVKKAQFCGGACRVAEHRRRQREEVKPQPEA